MLAAPASVTAAQVQTLLQGVHIREDADDLPVAVKRQTSAFPPNFVHSLDSTHMLLTAIEMDEAGVPFAAVHDSYWVHAGHVDQMNSQLRQVGDDEGFRGSGLIFDLGVRGWLWGARPRVRLSGLGVGLGRGLAFGFSVSGGKGGSWGNCWGSKHNRWFRTYPLGSKRNLETYVLSSKCDRWAQSVTVGFKRNRWVDGVQRRLGAI